VYCLVEVKAVTFFELLVVPLMTAGLLFFVYSQNVDLDVTYVPVAIEGLATVSGILVGFITFSVSHAYSDKKSVKGFKKWAHTRLLVMVLFVFIISGLIWLSFMFLVKGNLESAFLYSQFGFVLCIPLILEIILILDSTADDYK